MSQLSFRLALPENFSVANIVQHLNARQREAVEFLGRPLAIIAGAGTGKTRVITHRIAYLIASHNAHPRQILALTFTDKAAAEMQERIEVMLPYGFAEVAVSTFHAFGDDLLREFAVDLGLDPDFKLLTAPEQALFLHEHLFELPLRYYRPLGNPTKFLHELLRHFSRLKDEDVTPEEYLAFAEEQAAQNFEAPAPRREAEKQLELARCYQAYQQLMAQQGCVDFGDQIALSTRLLREHPDARRKLQERFQCVLVDEFQDTNYAQFQLVKELVAPHGNLTVVADDDQSIYKFRGAAISNILNFGETYPNAHYIVLTENYRSTPPILEVAYRLIRCNDPDRLEVKRQIDKRLTTAKSEGQQVEHLHFESLDAEAESVAKFIAEKVQSGERTPRDFCVLVRANHAAEAFLRAFETARLPYRFSGNRGLFQRAEIRLLLAFMRSLANPRDDLSLYQLALSEIYRTPMADLQSCLFINQSAHRSLLYIFKHLDSFEWEEPLSPQGRAALAKLVADHEKYLELSRSTPAYAVLYDFLKESGYLAQLTSEEALEGDQKIRNLAKFFNTVRNYAHFTAPGDLAFFVRHLDLLRDFGDDPGAADADVEADAVQVMTVHKAKGLEFPVVFVVGLVEQQFPTRKRGSTIELPEALIKDKLPEGDFHLQEERRLFYVALTRAQEELYLTSARDYGNARPKRVSRFVYEALGATPQEESYERASPLVALSRFEESAARPHATPAPLSEEQTLALDSHKIDDYISCPLKYKYRHVLHAPFPPSHALIYGEAVHAAIKEYLQRKRAQLPVTSADLLRVFRAKWRSFGFLNREHETQRLAQGEAALQNFFAQQEREPVTPAYIEEPFHLRFENVTISGRWDRVDELADGRVFITDYKSSEIETEEQAYKRVLSSRQLRIYAWSYEERFPRQVTAWRLHFVESGLIGEVARKERLLQKIREEVREVARGIRRNEFGPTPGPSVCPFCPYQEICPNVKLN
jgi:DNA helicase-2/ATP-dependent DNA helicase PcrA